MDYIDLTCPAEIFRTAMPTEEIPAATLTLFNLSDRVITSVEVLLRLLDADGGETERLAYRGRALNGRPHSTFLLTVPCAPSAGIRSLSASVEKVWYADNDTWRANPDHRVAYEPNALPVSPALTRLKYAAGETAVGYPSLQNGLWLCVCGRPNPEEEPFCARCGLEKAVVFSRFTPEAVETQITMKQRQLDLNSRNIREDTIRMQRIREEEYARKKRRRGNRRRLAFAAVLALALTAGVLFYGEPFLRLSAGRRALETGDAAGAKAAFTALGTFGGADTLIPECDWLLARQAADDAATAEELEQASALLRAVEGRPEALEIANEKDLLRARLLFGNGDWDAALQALSLLPEEYEGRAELEQDCLAAKARSLQEAGQYAGAREIWLSLGDLPGAREQASRCIYDPAVALMEQGDWAGAIEQFSMIPDFSDSRDRTLECHYRIAEELEAAGDREGASREFLLAGDWGDASQRYAGLTFAQAEELFAAGDIRAAQSLYAAIPDYPEAKSRDQACRYLLAKEAADMLEYTTVLELLKGIPNDYEQTGDLWAEASYQKAKAAVRQEDWASAAALLAGVDREAYQRKYRDIETLYLEACEKAGIEPYPATPEPESAPAPAAEATPEPKPEAEPEPEPEPEAETTPAPSADPFLVTEDE